MDDEKQLNNGRKIDELLFINFTLSTTLFKMLIKKDANIFSDSKNYF